MRILLFIGNRSVGKTTIAASFYASKNGYRLKLKLEFINLEMFTLNKLGDEFIIDLANQRHNFILPKFTNYLRLDGYE